MAADEIFADAFAFELADGLFAYAQALPVLSVPAFKTLQSLHTNPN